MVSTSGIFNENKMLNNSCLIHGLLYVYIKKSMSKLRKSTTGKTNPTTFSRPRASSWEARELEREQAESEKLYQIVKEGENR